MRHNIYGKHLGRTKNERTSLFKSLIGSLILHGSITTTQTKAKAIKGLTDKIITQAKNKQSFSSSFLTQKKVTDKLFNEVVPSLEKRKSGFTSIVKMGPRKGDNSMMVKMKLLMEEKKAKSKKKI
ncbi:MAG: large subunit ribosomal protein L17 [Microgenomates group bacterium Gr01-1014_93]|nr:MAG: large subunit ribosomal protein L17 [Microgenomates group bacterium Gr01-1014_93]